MNHFLENFIVDKRMLKYVKRIDKTNPLSVCVYVKTRVILLLLLVCLPLAVAFIPPASANQPQLIISDFQRNGHIQEYGVFLVTDTITFFNPGPEPAFSVLTAYPLSQIANVKAFRAETVDGTDLAFQKQLRIGSNCTGWQIFLPEPLLPDQTATLVTKMSITDLMELDASAARLTFSPFPTSPYFIEKYTTELTFHEALTAPTQTTWTGTNIRPYSYEERTVILDHITNDFLPLITYLELTRTFYIDAWGYLFAHEEHTFQLDSANPRFANRDRIWNAITLTLPPGSQFLKAYDQIGNLSSTIITPANFTHSGKINVNFMYHLEKGDVYKFFLDYRIPLDYHQLVLQTGQQLVFNPYYNDPFLIRCQMTEFVLPPGSWLQGVAFGIETTISPTGQYLLKLQDTNVTSIHQGKINIYYVYPIQPALSRPLLFFLIVGIFCLGYIAVRRVPYFREEVEAIAPTIEIDPAILSEFCALYGEKIALLLQTERLEQTMLQGKISKPRYRKEKKNFERKLRSLERELANRSQTLIETGGKYEASCRQLELLEAERVSAIEALHALEQRYRQKRITAAVYQKLQKDLQKRRDRAVGRMDRILLTLREELVE